MRTIVEQKQFEEFFKEMIKESPDIDETLFKIKRQKGDTDTGYIAVQYDKTICKIKVPYWRYVCSFKFDGKDIHVTAIYDFTVFAVIVKPIMQMYEEYTEKKCEFVIHIKD